MTDKGNGNGNGNGKIITLFPEMGGAPKQAAPQQFNLTIGWNPALGSVMVSFDESVRGFGLRSDDAERLAKTILSHLQFKELPFHRTAPPLPVDAPLRKAEVEWLMEHPLWTYPVEMRCPPEGGSYFGDPIEIGDVDKSGHKVVSAEPDSEGVLKAVPLLFDGPDWQDEVHRIGGGFYESVETTFHHVDPLAERIHDELSDGVDDPRNNASRVWVEAGGWYDRSEDDNEMIPEEGWNKYNRWQSCHDIRLDCGGPDWETALMELARLVRFFYHDDVTERAEAPEKCEGSFENDDAMNGDWISACEDDGDGFCKTCGYVMGWHESTPDEDKSEDA